MHRGIHTLSAPGSPRKWRRGEGGHCCSSMPVRRKKPAFVRGTTEGIVTRLPTAWGNSNVRAGDNIIISQMEHRREHCSLADALRTRWRRAACDPAESRRYVATGDAAYAV
ncbi:hypothetical protein ACLB1S_16485 [Escherichia coli]